jgi:hypothetical protein
MAQQLQNTFSQLKVRTRRYLKEETASTSHWSDDFLQQLINAQYRLRCAQLQSAFEGWFVNVATRDLEADVGRYSWPSNFQRETKLELVREDGRTVPLQRFERHGEINPPPVSGGDDYFPTWRPLSNGFVLEPTPTTTVSGGLRIEYEGLPEELTAAGDVLHPSFPSQLDELVVLDAAIAAFDAEGMQESGQQRSLLRLRAEWDFEWQKFIDQRVISRPGITPFITHYNDA